MVPSAWFASRNAPCTRTGLLGTTTLTTMNGVTVTVSGDAAVLMIVEAARSKSRPKRTDSCLVTTSGLAGSRLNTSVTAVSTAPVVSTGVAATDCPLTSTLMTGELKSIVIEPLLYVPSGSAGALRSSVRSVTWVKSARSPTDSTVNTFPSFRVSEIEEMFPTKLVKRVFVALTVRTGVPLFSWVLPPQPTASTASTARRPVKAARKTNGAPSRRRRQTNDMQKTFR